MKNLFSVLFSAIIMGCATAQDLFSTSNGNGGNIYLWDGRTGQYIEQFARQFESGMSGPEACVFNPTRNELYAGCGSSRKIYEFDAQTGTLLRSISNSALSQPYGLALGPDGYLYLTNAFDTDVLRFDPVTGDYLGEFISRGYGGLGLARGLTFDSQGNLYVSSTNSHSVKKYAGTTGLYMGDFASGPGMDDPGSLTFGPDGTLYVKGGTSKVCKFRGTDGAFLGYGADADTTPLDGPSGVAIGPDGQLYVSDRNNAEIMKFQASDGTYLGIFSSGYGLSSPEFCLFGPSPGGLAAADLQVLVGRVAFGGLYELGHSDDVYFRILPGIVANQHLAPIKFELGFQTGQQSAQEMRIRFEGFGPPGNVERLIEMFNPTTAAWEEVSRRPQSNQDIRFQVGPGPDPNRYLDTSGRALMRLSWRPLGPIQGSWSIRVDDVKLYLRG